MFKRASNIRPCLASQAAPYSHLQSIPAHSSTYGRKDSCLNSPGLNCANNLTIRGGCRYAKRLEIRFSSACAFGRIASPGGLAATSTSRIQANQSGPRARHEERKIPVRPGNSDRRRKDQRDRFLGGGAGACA